MGGEKAEAVAGVYLGYYGGHFLEFWLSLWIKNALPDASDVRGQAVDAVGVYAAEVGCYEAFCDDCRVV